MMYQRTCERCGRPVQPQDVADQNLERWEKFPESFKKELLQKRDDETHKYIEFQNFMKKSRRLCMFLGALIFILFTFNAVSHNHKNEEALIDIVLGASCGYILHKHRGGLLRGLLVMQAGFFISASLQSIFFGAMELLVLQSYLNPGPLTTAVFFAALNGGAGVLFGLAIQNMIENKLGVG